MKISGIDGQEQMQRDNAKLLAAVKAMLRRVDACEEDCGLIRVLNSRRVAKSCAYEDLRETLEPLRAMVEGDGA